VRILRSAYKHGIVDADILHALDHLHVVEDIGEDPDRWLVLGSDRAANLLELVIIDTKEGESLVIHAMPMRTIYEHLLRQ
jgi:hypothetical protein